MLVFLKRSPFQAAGRHHPHPHHKQSISRIQIYIYISITLHTAHTQFGIDNILFGPPRRLFCRGGGRRRGYLYLVCALPFFFFCLINMRTLNMLSRCFCLLNGTTNDCFINIQLSSYVYVCLYIMKQAGHMAFCCWSVLARGLNLFIDENEHKKYIFMACDTYTVYLVNKRNWENKNDLKGLTCGINYWKITLKDDYQHYWWSKLNVLMVRRVCTAISTLHEK